MKEPGDRPENLPSSAFARTRSSKEQDGFVAHGIDYKTSLPNGETRNAEKDCPPGSGGQTAAARRMAAVCCVPGSSTRVATIVRFASLESGTYFAKPSPISRFSASWIVADVV